MKSSIYFENEGDCLYQKNQTKQTSEMYKKSDYFKILQYLVLDKVDNLNSWMLIIQKQKLEIKQLFSLIFKRIEGRTKNTDVSNNCW